MNMVGNGRYVLSHDGTCGAGGMVWLSTSFDASHLGITLCFWGRSWWTCGRDSQGHRVVQQLGLNVALLELPWKLEKMWGASCLGVWRHEYLTSKVAENLDEIWVVDWWIGFFLELYWKQFLLGSRFTPCNIPSGMQKHIHLVPVSSQQMEVELLMEELELISHHLDYI